MTNEKNISVEQFIAALQRQSPISAIINAARKVEVDEITEAEERALAKGIAEFAGTKNGPMLLMGLPGPLQALLSFSGTVMPGLDRLGCLKATPRQVVNRLLKEKDDLLLKKYPFERVDKTDWAHYFRSCNGDPVPPFLRFLKVPDSAGGFSDEEIGEGVLANRRMVDAVPLDRIQPDAAAELIVSGTAKPFWQKYDLARFGKEHWRKILMGVDLEAPPRECVRFLSNQGGRGFSNDELIELAHYRDFVSKWIDPEATPFKAAYALRVKGRGLELWRRFPFAKLGKTEWATLLANPQIDIPPAFAEAVKKDVFSVAELCGLAKKNKAVVDYIPCDKLSPQAFLDVFLATQSQKLWEGYDFRRLSDRQFCVLVEQSPEREKWPKEISDKFSSAEGSFPDSEILSLAEKNIVNVIELLSPKRIHQSGEAFFEKICDAASESKPAVSAITRKLTIGQKPWLELRQEFQCALLTDIPLCRKFVVWQEFDLKHLDRLLTAAKVFKDELRGGRKFRLFVWRHWLFLTVVALAAACLAYRMVSDYRAQVRLRMLEEREAAAIEYINTLNDHGDYAGLERYVNLLSNGVDAHLLWDSQTIEAMSALKAWQVKREAVRRDLDSLKQIATDGWDEPFFDTARRCFASLDDNDSVLNEERGIVASYRRAFDAREREVASRKATLHEAAVRSQQVERLHKEVIRLRSRIEDGDESEFLAVEAAYAQLKNKPSFARYRQEYSEEYDTLGADVQKRRFGINRAGALLANAKDVVMSVSGVKATESNIGKCLEILQTLESWQKEFALVVKWKTAEVEQLRREMTDLYNGLKEREALVSAINNAKDYEGLYDSIRELLNKHPDSFECRQIDASRILDESQAKSAATTSGWLFSEVLCEFVGVIEVCPQNAQDVVPLLNRDVAPDADIYCVCPRYDADSMKSVPAVRKVFTRTLGGGFKKVGKIDYNKCQGLALFVCRDPSYVDLESWTPGEEHSLHKHWIASAKPGAWVEEPGYVTTSVLGDAFSEVEWDAHKVYLDGMVRSGDSPGEWQKRLECWSCAGSGETTHSNLIWTCYLCEGSGRLQRKIRCPSCSIRRWPECSNCDGGYQWSNPFTCTNCRGVGRRYDQSKTKCLPCSGTGCSWVDIKDANEITKVVERLKQETLKGDL